VDNNINLSKSFGVYQIKCLVDSKVYIGSTTKSFYKRWSQWKTNLKHNKANRHLQNAYNKYGADNFEFTVIEVIENEADVLSREQYWMDYHQSYLRENGYNFDRRAASGRTGTVTSEETKRKMSESQLRIGNRPPKMFGNTFRKGIATSNLQKKRTAENNRMRCKGVPLTEEHKRKLSEVGKKRRHSEETKRKMSEAQLRRQAQNR
jgi:group I intron endonuclease